ncbi:putative secologanin synthase [Helianthus debilis subsp. tardiflorus]
MGELVSQMGQITRVLGVLGVASVFLFYIWRISNWLWFKPKKIEQCLRDQGLKGKPYKFIFGDVKEMQQMTNEAKAKPINLSHDISHRVLPFVYKYSVTSGRNFFTWIGPTPIVHVSEPSMVREVLANYRKFQKARSGNPLRNLLAMGLFFAEGDRWVKHRKIINPAFHVEKLKHMEASFYVKCSEMIEKWEKLVTRESSCEVDVWPFLYSFSGDVISHTAFGSSFEEGRKIFELQREQATMMLKIDESVYIPGSRFLPTKNNKRMKAIEREVKATIKSIIDKRVVAMNSGQDTTGNTLVWTMILLSQHIDWQTRAREEVLHIFGDRTPDFNGLNYLKTMNIILNEVLRLYPVAPVLRRVIHEEAKLGNLTLPAGTIIQLNTLFIHHDKEIWGEDASEFNPERFSEGVSKATKKPGEGLYIPFGGGPRICIGLNFAMLEMKMALAMILQGFSFELSPSYSHAPQNILTMQPQFGAHLILRKL